MRRSTPRIGGFPGWFDTASSDTENSASAKGLKSDGDLTVSVGTITLDCMDDALHCAGALTVSDAADLTIATGDDGLHSDDTLTITGGKIDISTSYEGLEAVFIEISGGEITLVSSDDGLNAAGGSSADTDFDFMGPPEDRALRKLWRTPPTMSTLPAESSLWTPAEMVWTPTVPCSLTGGGSLCIRSLGTP